MENNSLNPESATFQENNANVAEESEAATVPQEQSADATSEAEGGTSAGNGTESVPAPFMTVQHNHEDVQLSEAEATDWIQIGMASKSMLETVRRAAALKGVDVKSFIEGFEKAEDESYRAELIAKYGEDDKEAVDGLMELYQSRKESTIKAAQEAETKRLEEQKTTLEGRLAHEFIELQKEFPEIEKFDALPKSVVSAAAKGKDLLSAYLRYIHTETKKAEAAKQTADAAKKASAGSMSTAEGNQGGAMDALMQGLYG